MGYMTEVIGGVFGVFGICVSSYYIYRGQRMKASIDETSAATTQMDAIFKGYSQIVANLQDEVNRLKATIEELRLEQIACEERNDLLNIQVEQLSARLASLEKTNG